MKGLKFLIPCLGIFVLYLSYALAEKEDLRKSIQERLKGLERGEETKIFHPPEELLQKIINQYKIKNYEEVARLEKRLPKLAELSPEEMRILAESLLKAGEPERAIEWGKRIASLKRGTKEECEANFIILQALYLLDKVAQAKEYKEKLQEDLCQKELAVPLTIFSYLYEKAKLSGDSQRLIKAFAEVSYPRISYFLAKGKLDLAEKEIYTYLSLTGNYRQGGELFLKLAEAYFRLGHTAKAKVFYQLVISEWDLTQEAFIAKYRLYQIAYLSAKDKRLLPAKTIEDLLGYLKQLKTKYEGTKLAEEADLLEGEIYYNQKNWRMARSSLKDFLQKYQDSPSYNQTKDRFCEVEKLLQRSLIEKGKISEPKKLLAEDEPLLREFKCGDPFLPLANFYFDNYAYTASLEYFTKALIYGLSSGEKKDTLEKISFVSQTLRETELANEILAYLGKNFKKESEPSPYLLYLKTLELLKKDPQAAFNNFTKLRATNLPSYLKANLLNRIFLSSIEKENLSLAYQILTHPVYNPSEDDFILFLALVLKRNLKLFSEVYPLAKKKFPSSPRLLFLSALYQEKIGRLKESEKNWKELSSQSNNLAILGEAQKKIEELFDNSRGLVY